MANRRIDVPKGTVFGRLTVIAESDGQVSPGGELRRNFTCKCECGTVKDYLLTNLRQKNVVKSCGCFTVDRMSTHGLSNTPEYKIWVDINFRCKDVTNPNYGGRGISVCERWQNSFEMFFMDMGPRPEGTSIERKDNSLGYSPQNCTWATTVEQANNKRNNRLLTHNGETLTVAQWNKKLGFKRDTVTARLNLGWSVEDALSASTRPSKKLTYQGETLSAEAWAVRLGIKAGVIYHRINKLGWSVEQTFTTPVKPRRVKPS